jgi:EAL domain-containing protein (putative c-di-GMP-specific phosphodiesterase class I)
LIELADELGIATVVEGIETEAEWDWAMQQGARYAQGYLFGKPTPNPRPALLGLPAAMPGCFDSASSEPGTNGVQL